jgi:iron complex outermembrane receptor protein
MLMSKTRSILLLLAMCCGFGSITQAQKVPLTINGTITNDAGNPLPGATVRIEGSFLGTSSNTHGKYRLTGAKPGEVIITASFIGYEPHTDTLSSTGGELEHNFQLQQATVEATEFVVEGTRADDKTPMAVENVDSDQINLRNAGQDIPYILDMSTSVVTTSDAGAGVGYSGMRIRGSDATRVNVTINGIPLNDPESQGVFWVNMPDFASTTNSIQIQRGVGSSTNGAGAFGGTVNLNTTDIQQEGYGQYEGGVGSFNTWRHSITFGSGLVNDKFVFDGRLSSITSDGYVDRAESDLKSYYFRAGYIGKTNTLQFITFNGLERTYQAWNGVPEDKLDDDRTYNAYTYDDEVDNYNQNHYQLHFTQRINEAFNFSAALHYTKGQGYFEQYKGDRYNPDLNNGSKESFADYNLDNVVIGDSIIEETNLIRRRWLDNDFYGGTYTLDYRKGRLNATFGGAYNQFVGGHYGEIIWAEYASNSEIYDRYYDNEATKTDFNNYLKVNYQLNGSLNVYGDLQYRLVTYNALGLDQGNAQIDVSDDMAFFNPKGGLTYEQGAHKVYGSVAVAQREPNRNDYIDADPGTTPESEELIDYELGYRYRNSWFSGLVNFYYMDYVNQLVNTGELNDVGSPVRTNIENTYRAGVEIETGFKAYKGLDIAFNATLSQNKIDSWTEQVDNWDGERVTVEHSNTDIAFSPSVIGGITVRYQYDGLFLNKGEVKDKAEIALFGKYVGEQFVDNTESDDRKLDAYFVNDARFSYTVKNVLFKEITAYILVRNVLDVEYESNAWTYRYYSGGSEQQLLNYFPQAGTNFMTGVQLRF